MRGKVDPPIFTLRGHNVGVTSLAYCILKGNSYLISGDEEGSIVVWDLSIFRRFVNYSKVLQSRVQSLKVIKLEIKGDGHDVLIAQSRNNGIQLLDLDHAILNQSDSQPKILTSFPTFDSLFSRGDAINIDNSQAILAYPSYLENYLVTLRIIGSNAETQISGTAQRKKSEIEKNCPVFDILIKKHSHKKYLLFVAYEDGCLCIFEFCLESTKTIPVLNSKGLRMDLIKKFDLKIGDFISAFDIVNVEESGIIAVCGSPLNNLIFLSDTLDPISESELNYIALKRQGVSSLSIRPDKKIIAVGSWDATVKLYSMKSRKLLANLNHHLKQVQDILFIESPDIHQYTKDNHLQSNSDKKNKYLLCCASMEGTISISSIY